MVLSRLEDMPKVCLRSGAIVWLLRLLCKGHSVPPAGGGIRIRWQQLIADQLFAIALSQHWTQSIFFLSTMSEDLLDNMKIDWVRCVAHMCSPHAVCRVVSRIQSGRTIR